MLNFLWFALGLGALLVALCLCTVLLRLHRTLSAVEQTLLTADESLREIVPEVQGSLGNVNNLTAGVNIALRSAGTGASRVGANVGDAAGEAGRDARAAAHGFAVGFRAFWRGVTKRR